MPSFSLPNYVFNSVQCDVSDSAKCTASNSIQCHVSNNFVPYVTHSPSCNPFDVIN